MQQPTARYNFPKAQVADQLTSWDRFVVIGKDTNGQTHILANGDQRAAQELLGEVRELVPSG